MVQFDIMALFMSKDPEIMKDSMVTVPGQIR